MIYKQLSSVGAYLEFGGKKFLIDPRFAPEFSYSRRPDVLDVSPSVPTINLPADTDLAKDVDAIISTCLDFSTMNADVLKSIPAEKLIIVQNYSQKDILDKLGMKNVKILGKDQVFDGVRLNRTLCYQGMSKAPMTDYDAKNKATDEACGVMFSGSKESGAVYLVGESYWFLGIEEAIRNYQPKVIIMYARTGEGPNLDKEAGINEIKEIAKHAPAAFLILSQDYGVPGAEIESSGLQAVMGEEAFSRISIPKVGNEIKL